MWLEQQPYGSDTRRVVLAMELLAAKVSDDALNHVEPARHKHSATETYKLLELQMSKETLAVIEGVSVQAIKMRLYRARKSGHSMPRLNKAIATGRPRSNTFSLSDQFEGSV